jgi:hypothetical protein
MNEPREFEIRNLVTPEGRSATRVHSGPMPTKSEIIHVIEYSAYNTVRVNLLWLVKHAIETASITRAVGAKLLGVSLIDLDQELP